jgi:hypothetical protein
LASEFPRHIPETFAINNLVPVSIFLTDYSIYQRVPFRLNAKPVKSKTVTIITVKPKGPAKIPLDPFPYREIVIDDYYAAFGSVVFVQLHCVFTG